MDVYLQDAGIIMMTNANEEENGMIYYPVMARHASYENGEMFRGPPPAMAVMRHDVGAPMLMLSGGSPAPLEVRIRKDFYETFIWETFDLEDKEDAVQEEEEDQEENDIRIKKRDISEEEEQVTEETKQDVEESQTELNQESQEENQTQGTTVATETTQEAQEETQTQASEVKHLDETTTVTQEQSVVTEVTEPTTTKSPDQEIPKDRFVIHGGSG